MRVCPRCSAIFKAQVASCSNDGTTLIERQDDPHLSSPIGRFILEALIAEGVTGRIYRAGDAAVRILYGDFGTQELFVKRMFRDIEVAKDLQHPNVARILDAGTDDGSTWVAWELARGQSLNNLILTEDSASIDRVGSICAQIAAALAEAHEAEILHRNLSPTNVMVAPKGKRDAVKVLDFGMASLSRCSQALRFRTRRDYAAPEALKLSGASKAADVYSVGLIASDLMGKAAHEKTGLASLVAEMIDPDPKNRPQSGRDLLSRLDDLGYSPIALPTKNKEEEVRGISEDLKLDLVADGLVLVGSQKVDASEPTPTIASLDLSGVDDDPMFVRDPASEPTNTTYVFQGGAPAEPTACEEIDIEASRRKLSLLETSRPKRETTLKDSKEPRRKSPLLHGPVTEKMRAPPNGSAKFGISTPKAPTEVTGSQVFDEVLMLRTNDRESVSVGTENTDGQPIQLPSFVFSPDDRQRLQLGEPKPLAEVLPPPPTLLSAAELSEPKAVGGVQPLLEEHGERASVVPRENPVSHGFHPKYSAPDVRDLRVFGGERESRAEKRPGLEGSRLKGSWSKGSWPTEDLVLPNKDRASMPTGSGDDPQRAPTSVIRTRGVFSSEFDVPDRPGLLNARETEIIRPRSPSEFAARADTLPIDRANTVTDPAEGSAGRSREMRMKPRRSLIPISVGALIVTIAAVAIALPRLDSNREKEVRRPVLIQAQPDPDEQQDEEQDMAEVGQLPEGDTPTAQQEPGVQGVADEAVAAETPKPPIMEKVEPRKIEATDETMERETTEKLETAKVQKAKAAKPKGEKPRGEKSRVVEVAEHSSEDALPDGDDPADRSPKKKKKKGKRSRAKTEAKKEQPEKLQRGTLIDPFAE